jgi:hypothetical protein
MAPEAARRDALIRLRGIEQTKERYRERRGLPRLETVAQDVSFAARLLSKNPGFTLVSVLTLALGIGASTAIFSVVNAVLLRPLSYPEPDRLVQLWETSPPGSDIRNVVNAWNFLDWRERSRSFAGMAAFQYLTANLTGSGEPRAVAGLWVSPEFFAVLGVAPFAGRTFVSEEGVPGQDASVILSYEFWQKQFGGSLGIVGQTLSVNGSSSTVVGIMPSGFSIPNHKADIWMPMQARLTHALQVESARQASVARARLRRSRMFVGRVAESAPAP